MRKITALFPLFLLVFSHSSKAQFGQIPKNFEIRETTDEYTGKTLISTTWIVLNVDNNIAKPETTYFKFLYDKADSIIYMQYKTTTHATTSVREGDNLFIKLANGEVITLTNSTYTFSERGAGSIVYAGSGNLGVSILLPIAADQLELLAENMIDKCKLITSEGYVETIPKKEDFRKEAKIRVKKFFDYLKDNN